MRRVVFNGLLEYFFDILKLIIKTTCGEIRIAFIDALCLINRILRIFLR